MRQYGAKRRSSPTRRAHGTGDAGVGRRVISSMRSVTWRVAVAICGTFVATACGADGVTGTRGERLDTQVSATRVRVGDSITVTLIVSNPTGSRLKLVYGSSVTYAEAVHGDTTFAGQVGLTAPDTLILAPGAHTSLRPLTLRIRPAGVSDTVATGSESLNLPPGPSDLAACAWVIDPITPDGPAFVPGCGQSVRLTVARSSLRS